MGLGDNLVDSGTVGLSTNVVDVPVQNNLEEGEAEWYDMDKIPHERNDSTVIQGYLGRFV